MLSCTCSGEYSLVNTQVPLGSTVRFHPGGVLRSRLALGMKVRLTWLRVNSFGWVGGPVVSTS